jgi:hypothetical protein
MFRDPARTEVFDQLRTHDLRVFAKQLTVAALLEAARRAGLRLWSCPLNCINLAWLALSAAWRQGENFASILTVTLKLLQDQEHFAASAFGRALDRKRRSRGAAAKPSAPPGKHRPYGPDPARVTEEAFAKARRRLPEAFWVELLFVLVERFEAEHGSRLRLRGFRLLAVDGTRLTLPEARALRAFYGTARNGHGRHQPQAQLVLLQSPLTRLPLAYQLGPVRVGEVTMARQLTRHLGGDDLLLLDSGYCSYGLAWDIQRRGASFCLRLQRAMNLRTLRRLDGRRDRLVRWAPKDSRGQWRREGLPRALDLRLVEYRVPGYRAVRLLTNVLSAERLPYADFSRLTTAAEVAAGQRPGVYHLRWQIETSYAELKVEQGLKGGLRSKTPAGIAFEVAGHVVLYLLVRWLMVEAAARHGLDPLRISFRNALRELDQLWPTLVVAGAAWVEGVLLPRLLERIASHVVPLRPGRSYPRTKKAKGKTKQSKRKKS